MSEPSHTVVGVDAVAIARFREVLARRPSIVERLFTEAEPSAIALHKGAAELARQQGIAATSLSMTHTEELAFAVVVGTAS